MVQMVVLDISHYGKIRIKFQERAVAFVGLGYYPGTCAV